MLRVERAIFPFKWVRRGRRSFPRKLGPQGWDAFSLLPKTLAAHSSEQRMIRTVGIMWIAYGAFRLAMAAAAILLAPTATVMFGALLGRVADPFSLMAVFHALYFSWAALCVVSGVLGLVGGSALLGGGARGRRLVVLASLLSLSDLPVGVALGVYTLLLFAPSLPDGAERTPD